MTRREELLAFIDGRVTDTVIFSPLVDSLFSASVMGKDWVSDVTLDDQIETGLRCGYHPMFIQGTTPELSVHPALAVEVTMTGETDRERRFLQTLVTPRGTLERTMIDRAREGMTILDNWVNGPEDLDKVDALSDALATGAMDETILEKYRGIARKLSPFGVTEIQVELPFFLYGLGGFADVPLILFLTETERFKVSMDKAERAIERICNLLIQAGIDLIWIGSPGTELLSPDIMQQVIIPQSRRLVDFVHARNGRVHFHCCGHSARWIENGYFNEIGMDLVETLSPPPSGNVDDLRKARAMISPSIVTKGNIDLGLLLEGSPEDCRAAASRVIEATAGYPHILGAADAILYGTPVENIMAVAGMCRQAGKVMA
jgi:hypothetical protein